MISAPSKVSELGQILPNLTKNLKGSCAKIISFSRKLTELSRKSIFYTHFYKTFWANFSKCCWAYDFHISFPKEALFLYQKVFLILDEFGITIYAHVWYVGQRALSFQTYILLWKGVGHLDKMSCAILWVRLGWSSMSVHVLQVSKIQMKVWHTEISSERQSDLQVTWGISVYTDNPVSLSETIHCTSVALYNQNNYRVSMND